MEIHMTFKEKLVKLRKLKGLTQDEFASAVGVSRQAVYKWESGQSYPEVPKLIEMKLLFDISIDDLLDENYEVIVPEKKRKRRLSDEAKRKIEEEVKKEEAGALPTAAAVVEEPVIREEPVTVTAPAVEESSKVEEAPAVEEPVKVEEAPAPKKRGFFGKLFGK